MRTGCRPHTKERELKKHERLLAAGAVLCLSLMWWGCGSAPAPEASLTEEKSGVLDEAAKAALDAAMAKADSSRQAAVDAGAEEAAPDKFAAAEAALAALKAKAAAGEDVSAELADLALCYDALAEYAAAVDAKNEIDENGWASRNQAEYDKGEAALAETDALLEQDDVTAKALYDKAREANDAYSKVLDGVYRDKAQKERTEAFKAKRNADSVYAGVSQKDRYEKAVESFRNGDRQYTFHHAKASYNNYVKAREEFTALYGEISESMAEADRAIQAAKKKRDESAALARQADKRRPIDDGNENLVEPGETLIEEETYEDPAQSVADVSAQMPEGGE